MDDEQDGINARYYLCEPFKQWCRDHSRSAFAGSNSFVYFKPRVPPVGPDLYIVNGGHQGTQSMWVSWEEDWRLPTLIVEFLSESTEHVDRGKKFELYRDTFKCVDYILCDRDVRAIEAYRLRNGVYVPARADRHKRVRCGSLPLLIGFHGDWLRFFNLDGTLVTTGEERAKAERERTQAERERAQAAEERADAAERRAQAALEELRELRRRLGLVDAPAGE